MVVSELWWRSVASVVCDVAGRLSDLGAVLCVPALGRHYLPLLLVLQLLPASHSVTPATRAPTQLSSRHLVTGLNCLNTSQDKFYIFSEDFQ